MAFVAVISATLHGLHWYFTFVRFGSDGLGFFELFQEEGFQAQPVGAEFEQAPALFDGRFPHSDNCGQDKSIGAL